MFWPQNSSFTAPSLYSLLRNPVVITSLSHKRCFMEPPLKPIGNPGEWSKGKNKSFWGSLKLTNKWCFWDIETTNLGGIQWIIQAKKYQHVKTSNLRNAMFCFRKFQCVFSRAKIFQGKIPTDLETTNQGNLQEWQCPLPRSSCKAALPGRPQGWAVPAPHGCFPQGVNPKAQW